MMYPYDPYPENHVYSYTGRPFFHALWSHLRFSIILNVILLLLILLIYRLQPYYEIVVRERDSAETVEPTRAQGMTQLPFVAPDQQAADESHAAALLRQAPKQRVRFPKAVLVYTVQQGDFLAKICRKFGVDLHYLVWYNGLQNPDMIYPGQKLSIPTRF